MEDSENLNYSDNEMKKRLLSGEDKVLKRAEMSPRQHFPPEVAKVGKKA